MQTEVLSAQEDKKGDAKGHCCPACWKRAKCTYTTCECSRAGKQCVNCHSPCCGNDGQKESNKSKNQGECAQSKDGKKQGASAAQSSEIEQVENDTKGELEQLQQQVAKLEKEVSRQRSVIKQKDQVIALLGQRIADEAKAVRSLEERCRENEERQAKSEQGWQELSNRLDAAEKELSANVHKVPEAKGMGRKRQREVERDEHDSPMEVEQPPKADSKNEASPIVNANSEKENQENQENQGELKREHNHPARKPSKDQEDLWSERRKRTLILKGLRNPNFEKVVKFLDDYKFASRKEVERVFIRPVAGKDWAFIRLKSTELVESSMRNRFQLKGSSFYIQRDLSKDVRVKMKEERLRK